MKSKKEIEEDLQHREEEAIKQLGYRPTQYIEDHEWELQLKRLQQSNEKEQLEKNK